MLLLAAAAQVGLAGLPLPRREQVVAFTSRDPSGGNEDWGHFQRTRADGRAVLAQIEGPGCIRRIWSAEPRGELEVRLDGEEVFAGPFARLFDGSLPPFLPPLAGRSGGGSSCWVPMSFARSCEVTAAHADGIYYHVDVARGPAAGGGIGVADRTVLAELVAPAAPAASEALEATATAGGACVATLPGSGEILVLRARLRRHDAAALRRQWLRMFVDGETQPCLSVPAALAFGCDVEPSTPASLDTLVTGGSDGWREFRLPMPFVRGAHVELDAADALSVRWRRLPANHGRLYLHGRFAHATLRRGEPFTALDVHDRGHLAGIVLAATGASGQGLSFLEGDERIVVDGRVAQAGTGTEDFFGGAWYFRHRAFAHPFHAVAVADPDGARVLASRWLIADPIPFTNRLQLELEHGGHDDAPGSVYAAAVFYYGAGAAGEAAPVPPEWTEPVVVPQPIVVPAAAAWPERVRDGVANLRSGDRAAWPAPWRAPAEVTLLDANGRPRARWLVEPRAGGVDAVVVPDAAAGVAHLRLRPWLPAVRTFRIAGPFGVTRPRQGIDEVFGPEVDATVGADYQVAGNGPRGWQRVTTGDWTGYVDLDAVVRPNDAVVVYAALSLRAARARRVRLVLGSDDSVKVLYGGRVVHRHVGRRGSVRDQDEVALDVEAGTTTLLLAVEDFDGGFGFHLRLEDAAGVEVDDGLPR